jgi:hypothetical protein
LLCITISYSHVILSSRKILSIHAVAIVNGNYLVFKAEALANLVIEIPAKESISYKILPILTLFYPNLSKGSLD